MEGSTISLNKTMVLSYIDDTRGVDHFNNADPLLTDKITYFVTMYWFPVLVPIGLVGNTLSFLVMIKPSNRKMSTCIYMAAISVNDNIMMLIAIRTWLVTTLKIHKRYTLECGFTSFSILLTLQNATYQVVAMTIDKFIAIKWPHKAPLYSTPHRAKWTAIGIYLVAILYNIPHILFSSLIGDDCVVYDVGGVYAKIYSWLTFIVNGIIPIALLITLNLTIVIKVRKSHERFVKSTSNNTSEQNFNIAEKRQRQSKNVESQLTVMLLLVTTLFLLLIIPTYVRYLYFSYAKRDTPEKQSGAMLFYHLSYHLYFTNSGINFFLYCISGKKFRDDLRQLLSCCGRKSRDDKMATLPASGASSL